MADYSFSGSLGIIKNGVYGKDVRQAIYDILSNQEELIAFLEEKVDNIQGGSTNQNAEFGIAVCGIATPIMSGSVSKSAVTKKF